MRETPDRKGGRLYKTEPLKAPVGGPPTSAAQTSGAVIFITELQRYDNLNIEVT